MKDFTENYQKAKVLIVEDSQESIDLLVYFLKPAGYEITTAADGIEAIQMIEKSLPDIILLDIMLPRVDGFQVCERLKKNDRTFHIPVIMITALKELKDKIRALEAGADDFISKPFDSVELLARVKSLLRLKFYYDELIKRNKELERRRQVLLREDLLKKELTNLIVHDMKNPLFVIQGNLQMMNMQKKTGITEGEDKYTKRIERSSRGLLRMILNLIDISRLEQKTMALEPVPIELPKLVRETIEYFCDIPENSNKKIQLKFDEDLPEAYLDRDVFERVLDNLFNYVFPNTPDSHGILVKGEKGRNDAISLKVYHEGKAIPPEFHEQIFKKFAQSDLKKAGFKPARGLGLIFCKFALNAHGGDIQVSPKYENGNCFELTIPTLVVSAEKELLGDHAVKEV
jgi:two-component system sensor histidine kinase/response regulator